MVHKALTLSIVIPVFNEQRYIKACLDSIAAQTVKPDEVIVVDNNSTDESVRIVEGYQFVKILHEPTQHQVFAQATGFNAATSDILGRIDADSILPPDWVDKIKTSFEDENVAAVTGGCNPYDVPLRRFGAIIFYSYIYSAGLIGGQRMLWGSNCAIKKQAWSKIKDKVLMRPDIWEDYDTAFCLKGLGDINYIRNCVVGVSFRAMHTSFVHHVRYQFRSVRTFYYRTNPLRLGLFCILWTLNFPVYPLAALDDWLLKRR
jgi:glycosyltransferase involved in cell wall biosynthesis